MNAIHAWLDPLALPLAGWTLRVSLLMAAALLLRAALGRRLAPRWRCLIWGVVLIRIFSPSLPRPTWPRQAPLPALATVQFAAPLIRIVHLGDSAILPQVPSATSVVNPAMSNISFATLFPSLLVAVWVTGVFVCLAHLAFHQLQLVRLLRSLPAMTDARIGEPLESLITESGVSPIRVLACDAPIPPAVAGFFCPTLILPHDLADQLSLRQLRLVLAHELLHIRRHDVLWRWLAALAVAVQWFNPLVRLARRCFFTDCELATDAAVLRGDGDEMRHAYGQAILTIASATRTGLPVGALGIFGTSGVSARISALITSRKPSRFAAAAVLLLVGCATVPKIALRASADDTPLVMRTYDVRDLLSDSADPAASAPRASTAPAIDAGDASKDVKALTTLAQARINDGDYAPAVVLLEKVLRIDPTNTYAGNALQVVQQRMRVAKQLEKEQVKNQPLDTRWHAKVQPLAATEPVVGLDLHDMSAGQQSTRSPQWLIDNLQDGVDPLSWQARGGRGTVAAHGGQLIVLQTVENLARVEALLKTVRAGRSVQVVIETHFLRGGHIAWLANELFMRPESPSTAVISEQQANALLGELKYSANDDANDSHLTAPRLTTFSGQRAFVVVDADQAYVSDVVPILGHDNGGKPIAAFQPTVSIVDSGVVLDCLATASADRKSVTLALHPQQANLLKMENVHYWDTEEGKRTKAKIIGPMPPGDPILQVPTVERAEIETTVTLPDRNCFLAILHPVVSPAGSEVETLGPMVLLVKPTIVDGSADHPNRSATTRLSDESLPR